MSMPPDKPLPAPDSATETTVEQAALHHFLDTFGEDRAEVLRRIHAYWNEGNRGLTTVPELYEHLMQARVESGAISEHNAKVLAQAFARSFSPEGAEAISGFNPKDRGPLINALTEEYLHPQDPATPEGTRLVARVGADIRNLGGLNERLMEAAKKLKESAPAAFQQLVEKYRIQGGPEEQAERLGRKMADGVIHAIATQLQARMAEVGSCLLIREGGDELGGPVILKDGITPRDVERKITEAQQAIDARMERMGLGDIEHMKYRGNALKAGVGLGVAALDAGEGRQGGLLDLGVQLQKHENEEGRAAEIAAGLRSAMLQNNVDLLLVDAGLGNYAKIPSPAARTPVTAEGATPEEAGQKQLRAQLQGNVTPETERALIHTYELTLPRDPKIGLIPFSRMQTDQLPAFMRRHGENGAKLVHFNLDNIAGGNKLAAQMGDRMMRIYKDAVVETLKEAELGKYTPYLAGQPPAAFAALLPGDVPDAKLKAMESSLKERLNATVITLPLEEQASVRNNIAADSDLQKKYGKKGEKIVGRDGKIPLGKIVNPKTGMPGIDAVVEGGVLDPAQPLGPQMKIFESRAEEAHKAHYAQQKEEKRSIRRKGPYGTFVERHHHEAFPGESHIRTNAR